MMTPTHEEALSRFFDGEPVAPDLLTESLTQPGAMELLLDFARLRQMATTDSGMPDPEFVESMRRTLRTGPYRRLLGGRLAPLALAASLALAALAGGYGARLLVEPWLRVREPAAARAGGPTVPPALEAQPPAGAQAAPPATKPAQPPAAASATRAGPTLAGGDVPSPEVRLTVGGWRETQPAVR